MNQEKSKGSNGDWVSRGLNIRLLFIIVTMLEILGTVAAAALLAFLLDYFFKTDIEVHPLIWLVLGSITIGVAVSVVVNIFLLRPIVRLNRAMKQVAQGDFTVRLAEDSKIREIGDSYRSFNLMTQELQATETLQTDFVSNVSHEFKTPINAIEGYATLLQAATSPEDQARYVERILLNTRRLSTLVGNILLLSKVSNNAISTSRSTFRLDEQIRQVILLMEPKWSAKDIEFDVDLDNVTWTGQENLVYHVWSNLLSNAIKFNPQEGLVRLRLKEEGKKVVFTIEDSGPGIPESEYQHVFNKFYQLDSSHKQEGNGLGLALCKQIVSSFHGDIRVETIPEGGCRFTVTLPGNS